MRDKDTILLEAAYDAASYFNYLQQNDIEFDEPNIQTDSHGRIRKEEYLSLSPEKQRQYIDYILSLALKHESQYGIGRRILILFSNQDAMEYTKRLEQASKDDKNFMEILLQDPILVKGDKEAYNRWSRIIEYYFDNIDLENAMSDDLDRGIEAAERGDVQGVRRNLGF